jgi:hypothetical protein
MLLIVGDIFFSINGVDRALRNANGTVNTLIWINGEEIRTFTETIHWANVNAVGIFAADAGFSYNVCHGVQLLVSVTSNSPF